MSSEVGLAKFAHSMGSVHSQGQRATRYEKICVFHQFASDVLAVAARGDFQDNIANRTCLVEPKLQPSEAERWLIEQRRPRTLFANRPLE